MPIKKKPAIVDVATHSSQKCSNENPLLELAGLKADPLSEARRETVKVMMEGLFVFH